ncbi:30S ribosomal protein S6 [Patescibacteria group bacterium]|nr:30S ribosomal protein S6 [Patescibacteria group bacterium]
MADIATDVGSEGLAGLFEADTEPRDGKTVYEVGYHLLPSLGAQEVEAWVREFSKFISEQGASLVGEKMPEKIDLAYPIYRRADGKFKGVTEAHFGWVAFELSPSAVHAVQAFMETNKSVLRFIVVRTSAEEVRAVMEGKMVMPKAQSSSEAIAAPKRAEEQSGTVSEADIDKAIASIDEN